VKKITLFLVAITLVLSAGCKKSDDNPVSEDAKGSISGNIKNSVSNQPVAGVKITLTQTSEKTVTDNSGNFTFANVQSGTYSIAVSDPGYKAITLTNISVSKGQTAGVNSSIQPYTWGSNNSDNNAIAAIPLALIPNVNGAPLSVGDAIGCFYDSLGIPACSGFIAIASTTDLAVPITIWGDDASTSGKKEGFAAGDVLTWKIKRQSDGKVFDANVTYKGSLTKYQSNATYEITQFSIITE
jgi:hypothetical protein